VILLPLAQVGVALFTAKETHGFHKAVGQAYTVQESPILNGTTRHGFPCLMRFLIKPCAFTFLIIGFQTLFVSRIAPWLVPTRGGRGACR
jgi:hypothetical protein